MTTVTEPATTSTTTTSPRRWRIPRERQALVAMCVALPLLEAVLNAVTLPGSSPSLAPQITAVAPFGIFHDLRWLSVYAGSWPTFAAGLAGILVARGLLIALCVRLAWPSASAPAPMRRLVLWGVIGTAVAAIFLAPSVALLFALAVVPVSWLFLAAVPLAFGVALVVHPMVVSGDWWKRAIPLRAIGWVALSFVVLTLAAAAIAVGPGWTAYPVVIAVGAFNAVAWVGMVGAIVEPHRARRVVPVVPIALAGLVAVVAVGSVLGFTNVNPGRGAAGARDAWHPPQRDEQPVLVASGYGSHWAGQPVDPVPGRFYEEKFSYLGLSPDGAPRPYTSADTVQPLEALDTTMAAQVDALHRATGRRVDIVAESEGALVAKTYLVANPGAPVGTVVMASPLLDPDRVSYPVGAASGGSGLVSRGALELLGRAYQSVAPIDLNPESPFLKSVDRLSPLLQDVLSCPAPGVHLTAILPLADATAAAPGGPTLPFPSVVVPAFHGGLVGNSSIDALIAAVLEGQVATGSGVLRDLDRLIAAGASAWQVPALALSGDFQPQPARHQVRADCGALARALRAPSPIGRS